ncbi:MAG: hypothetical protein NT013_09915 [Planctomycetia bacterium]|nr:hypothetical protein [Planctomycetia bacterium]
MSGSTSIAVEVLEVRQVMSGTSLTAAQIATAVSNAQTNKTNADAALQTAQGNYTTQTTTAINGLQTTLSGLTTAAQGAISGQETATQGVISGATATLNGAIQGLETALQGTISGFQSTLDSLLAAANTLHQTQVTAVQNQFQLDFSTIQSSYNSAVAGIVGGFQASVAAAQATYNGTINGAQSTFDTAVSGFDSLFQGLVTAQTTAFNTNEANDWTNLYLNVVGTGATGLQMIYNNAVSAADVILNGVLAANSSVVYDPSVILNSSTFRSYVAGQLAILQPLLQGDQTAYNTNVTNRQNSLTDQITGPSGIATIYQSQIAALESGFQHDADTLGGQLDTDLQGDEQTYMQALNGPGGLEDQLEATLDGEETTLEGVIQGAQGTYDTTMSGPETTLENTIETDIDTYENWLTSGNPYRTQADQRVDALKTQIQGFIDTYNGVVTGARTLLSADIATSNLLYWEHVYKPNATPPSAFDTFMSSIGSQQSTLNGELQTEFTDYQNNTQGVSSSYYTAMMNWMMNGMVGPMPVLNTSLIDGFAKDYWVNADIDSAGATDGIGGAYMAFVSTAVSEDTTREQSLDTAQAACATTIENAADAFVIAAENAIKACDIDLVNISHAFAADAATRYLSEVGDIDGAINIYELAQHGAANQYRKNADVAVNAYEKNCASDIDNFQHQANQKSEQYTINASGHETNYENALALKEEQLVIAEAVDGEAYAHSLNGLEDSAQHDLNGYAEAETQSESSDLLTFYTNIANELATEYAAYYGNAAAVVAVANAEAANMIAKFTAWKAEADGEATAFKTYANQAADDLKTAEDNIATGADQRTSQVAAQWLGLASTDIGAWFTEVSTLAPLQETANDSIADEERIAEQNLADKEKTADDTLADDDKQLADTDSSDVLNEENQEIGAVGANFTTEDNLTKGFDLFAIGEEFNFLAFVETQTHSVATGGINAKKSTAINLAAMDDPLLNAIAADQAAISSNYAWQTVANEANTLTSAYANKHPAGPVLNGTSTPPMPSSSAAGESSDAFLQHLNARTGTSLSQPSRTALITGSWKTQAGVHVPNAHVQNSERTANALSSTFVLQGSPPAQHAIIPTPVGPPLVPCPPGKNGEPNHWVPTPATGSRPGIRWKPAFPVSLPNGAQPNISWDPVHGHWDRINGDRTTDRFLPDGTKVDHKNQPIPYSFPSPQTVVNVGIGVGIGYCLYRGIRMIPSLVIPPLWPTIVPNLAIP